MRIIYFIQIILLLPLLNGQEWTQTYGVNHFEKGNYKCSACGKELFKSENKFKSNCGWPSFDKPAAAGLIDEERDTSHGMIRTEVLCQNCGGHLGHVFPDGPTETGLRYCINSLSIDLKEEG